MMHFRGDTTTFDGLIHPNANDLEHRNMNQKIVDYAETFGSISSNDIRKFPFMLATDDEAWLKGWDYPTLVKVGPVTETSGNHVLTMLNRRRYEEPLEEVVPMYDIPFDHKVDKLFWRGSTTGPT